MLSLSNLSRINRLEEIKQQEGIKKIIEQQEFNVALLGGPSVGKTSLLRKISNNYIVSRIKIWPPIYLGLCVGGRWRSGWVFCQHKLRDDQAHDLDRGKRKRHSYIRKSVHFIQIVIEIWHPCFLLQSVWHKRPPHQKHSHAILPRQASFHRHVWLERWAHGKFSPTMAHRNPRSSKHPRSSHYGPSK